VYDTYEQRRWIHNTATHSRSYVCLKRPAVASYFMYNWESCLYDTYWLFHDFCGNGVITQRYSCLTAKTKRHAITSIHYVSWNDRANWYMLGFLASNSESCQTWCNVSCSEHAGSWSLYIHTVLCIFTVYDTYQQRRWIRITAASSSSYVCLRLPAVDG